jgi:OmcA/MtrC family decaheme c-type cytochrome
LDFKTMIHGIHGADFREDPLQIVGFRGFSTHVYDKNSVQYPAPLKNCLSCHVGNSYGLPLADSVLAVTNDTGADMINPFDDKVASPAAATCASCHDRDESIVHMENNGGDFSTTQESIDNGITVELCANCHGPGKFSEVGKAHGLVSP